MQDFSDKGTGRGQVVSWDVYSKLSTRGTTLTETVAMPSSNYTVRQATGTVYEWGVEVPFTSFLAMLSQHNVTKVVKEVLARDCREALDIAARAQFARTLLRFVGTNASQGVLTTNGTATATNTSQLNKTHHNTIIDEMKERNIPAFRGDDYICIAHPKTLRPIKTGLEAVHQYVETGHQKILRGEIGRYDGARFLEQTNIAVGTGTAPNGTAWTGALSNWAFYMGSDTVAEIMVIPPEIRGKVPSDYGRSFGVAWYALQGFAIVYDSNSDPNGTNSRIVMWDSAA